MLPARWNIKSYAILIVLFIAIGVFILFLLQNGSTQVPAQPPASLWQGFTYGGAYKIEIDQPRTPVDRPIAIRVTGLQPKQPITLRARMKLRTTFESFATFVADEQGVVDVSRATPLYGTYTQPDAMGLFWSMSAIAKSDGDAARQPTDPLSVSLIAEANGTSLVTAQIQRTWASDQVPLMRQQIDRPGMVGVLYYPNKPGKYPTVILLGGSEGGMMEGSASLLASHEYAVLALAYFGVDPLPKELIEIPLEYIASAITWLKAQPAVDANRIAVMGGSKGGELALLVGATYPQDIHAVIAIKPHTLVYQGISMNFQNFQNGAKSSWTLNGKPVPFATGAITPEYIGLFVGQPVSFRSSYEQPLNDSAIVAQAAIAIEKIDGPILFVSGTDDQMTPSSRLCDMAVERLKANQFPHEYTHLKYEGAGHTFDLVYGPASDRVSGQFVIGGNKEINARATVDAWQKILAFLDKQLRN
ncbi:MAG: acyl-CoA thioesterase/BAAT N-terminal domain-containing protein [Chloroflexi bacterium]|nr:acyl-CoA thioesterase/BAAT N-terminal domain-containing protein [Chloroflexota bacterium]